MPSIDFRRLREFVTMADVLDLLGFEAVERAGNQVRGKCPFHVSANPGKSRSFSANLKSGAFQCFRCGVSENHLDLWAKATNQSIYQAAMDLCGRLNKQPPELAPRTEKRNP